jgi:V/A-type H+-transporting ATPase subunit D
MAITKIHPTRINLIRTNKTLNLAKSGHDVLERKRDVLMRELRRFAYDARKLREELTLALAKPLQSLREANVMMGSETVENVALASSVKAIFVLDHRSIMGVPVPIVKFQKEEDVKPDYGFADTSASLDRVFKDFYNVLGLIAQLAEIEGAVFQIASDVQRTQKRVNALEYVFIPMYSETVKHIELVLEEKEREEFVRMKTAKKIISRKKSMR